MKLRKLMDSALDEVYFCVVTPDENEHIFLNSDYIGAHPDVMPELEPLLDREFDDFDLVIRKDPEALDVENSAMLPMVYVTLNPTKKEKDKARKEAEHYAKLIEMMKARGSKGRKRPCK